MPDQGLRAAEAVWIQIALNAILTIATTTRTLITLADPHHLAGPLLRVELSIARLVTKFRLMIKNPPNSNAEQTLFLLWIVKSRPLTAAQSVITIKRSWGGPRAPDDRARFRHASEGAMQEAQKTMKTGHHALKVIGIDSYHK